MIAPIVDIEVVKLACVLAFGIPVVMIGGAGCLYWTAWLMGKLWRIRR